MMIEVYYSHEISDALLYYKDGMFMWSTYSDYWPGTEGWEEDGEGVHSVKGSPQVHVKIFEMEE
jgi:hypothetical protein